MTCPTQVMKLLLIVSLMVLSCNCAKKKKKDITDYTDADMERILDEWEEHDEDKLDNDELPEWKREPPKVDMSKINIDDPEGMLKMTKKGKSLMMFATVSGKPTETETEKITKLWQGSLFNANFETQRYVVGENRVIFMLKDGALAWDVKKFLIQQDRCEEVTIEGKSYPGKGSPNAGDNDASKKEDDGKKKSSKKKKSDKKDNTSKSKDNSTRNKDKAKGKKTKEPKSEL